MQKKRPRIRVKEGTGNVFADLGFANPEREQIKASLTLQIYRLIKKRDLTQVEAWKLLGIKRGTFQA
jgi:predicted XRE-type DNA-binding protein